MIGVARIVRPQGRRGEVVADLMTDFPERFAKLDVARVKLSSGMMILLKIESSRLYKGRVVFKFAGCDSIDEAEELRHALVMITREQLVELPNDTYFDFDLVGCEVTTTDGKRLGFVAGVQNYGSAPLLEVRDDEGREHLVPLVQSICVEIDIARKFIRVNPPEGLLEL
jgi:16S rRNA processing protein RimM